jgi:hypothetical protein
VTFIHPRYRSLKTGVYISGSPLHRVSYNSDNLMGKVGDNHLPEVHTPIGRCLHSMYLVVPVYLQQIQL